MPTSPTDVFSIAQGLMGQRKWVEAAELLAGCGEGAPFQLNVCRNLAALERSRPHVYAALMSTPPGERYTIGSAASGHPTVFFRRPDGTLISLSPGNQPVASLSSTFASIKENYQAGKPMAVMGIGDGYFLKSASMHPPTMAFGAEQAVYLFEPDALAILVCLMLHDYTGPTGPIEQERFHWFVGDGYLDQARDCLIGESYNPSPIIEIGQSPNIATIAEGVRGLLAEFVAGHRATQARVNAYYASIPDEHWHDVFAGKLNRKPRVLLVTTRLSSVLQYSTRDAADGFRAAGWEALVSIEPKPYQTATLTKVLEQLDQFKPDLVFQIDHLRTEWRGAFPEPLPFACWIQDHLPNLTAPHAGAKITSRDFILVGMPAMYVERYRYPQRQCIELTKLTRVPSKQAAAKQRGDDLVYVSSASQQPEEMAQELGQRFDHSRELSTLVAEACRDQIARYGRGESLPTRHAVNQAFIGVEARLGMEVNDAAMRDDVIDALFDRMNNLLFRQQGLFWASVAAEKQGLQLSIYGPGWEKHPTFARFARGVVRYGPDLEELTQRSKINLCLEPFFSVSHQRLLDGLAARGFFLVRDHPSNSLFPELLQFISTRAPHAESIGELRFIPGAGELLKRCECLGGYGDIVRIVRDGERAGVILRGRPALPSLPLVSFDSFESLTARLLAFAADPDVRRRIVERQRASVEERFSYTAGIKRVLNRIRELIPAGRLATAA